jgi:hypothetical protein
MHHNGPTIVILQIIFVFQISTVHGYNFIRQWTLMCYFFKKINIDILNERNTILQTTLNQS